MAIFELDGVSAITPPEGQYWVAPNANLIGKVELKSEASVWFNVVARGDNELIRIGARSNVQDGSVMHTDMGFPLTIGEDVTIGHMAMLHGCTIGNTSLIGIGATVLNGARIGNNSLVGAHALVTEGKEFPDNSLIVGTPARVVRTLGDDDVAMLKASADHYVQNWKRYASGLKEAL
ncbi:MAG: gamma carbonic anhydrase family protein [Robiginitomaculum sp.]|nr:gamma carbonic anhydrase family protein [Robiginitomaculum sp.]MDQ7078963.1 gamma carbonic anhydrase family protein [Robiginitomaculum sp.]